MIKCPVIWIQNQQHRNHIKVMVSALGSTAPHIPACPKRKFQTRTCPQLIYPFCPQLTYPFFPFWFRLWFIIIDLHFFLPLLVLFPQIFLLDLAVLPQVLLLSDTEAVHFLPAPWVRLPPATEELCSVGQLPCYLHCGNKENSHIKLISQQECSWHYRGTAMSTHPLHPALADIPSPG